MARNLSAEKSDRQGAKRRLRNKMIKSKAKTLVKDFVELVEAQKKDDARKAVQDGLKLASGQNDPMESQLVALQGELGK